MGSTRTFWEFYRGMGLGVTIGLTTDALLMWFLGSLARREAARLRPMMATLMVAYFVSAINSYEYFFFAPVLTEILIGAAPAAAIATASADAVRLRQDSCFPRSENPDLHPTDEGSPWRPLCSAAVSLQLRVSGRTLSLVDFDRFGRMS